MPADDLIESLRAAGLLPFQARFVADALADETDVSRALVAQAGLGVGRTLVELAVRTAERARGRGVLYVVATNALALQFEHLTKERTAAFEVLALAGTNASARSRARDGKPGWSSGLIVIATVATVRRPEMARSFTEEPWALVIVDGESAAASPVVRAIATPGPGKRVVVRYEDDARVPAPNTVVTAWDRRVVDWEGRPLFAPLKRYQLHYRRSEAEESVAKAAVDLASELDENEHAPPGGGVLAAAASSPLALLTYLRRLLEGSAATGATDDGSDDLDQTQQSLSSPAAQDGFRLTAIELLIGWCEDLAMDTKADCFLEGVRSLLKEGRRAVVVCTGYLDTLRYVREVLLEGGIEAHELSGVMAPDSRWESVNAFRERGGVLVCTDGMIPGIGRAGADVLVHYDVPRSRLIARRRSAVVQAFGGPPALEITLHDDSGVFPTEARAIAEFVDRE